MTRKKKIVVRKKRTVAGNNIVVRKKSSVARKRKAILFAIFPNDQKKRMRKVSRLFSLMFNLTLFLSKVRIQ